MDRKQDTKRKRMILEAFYINGPDSSINNIERQIRQYSEVIKPYDRYRHHATTGVFAAVLLVTVCSSLGVILGVLGSDDVTPDERGCASNSGGCFLMVSSMLILTISTLFMLVTTLTFALGAPLEEIVCGNLRDLESLKQATLLTLLVLVATLTFALGAPLAEIVCGNLRDLESIKQIEESYFGEGEYQLAGLILDNDSIPLTFSGLLGDCKDNKALFEVAKLETRFDLDDLLNYTKYFDIQGEIDRINIDLGSVDVYSADLADQLRDFREGLDVDFSGFYSEFEDLTPTTSLDDLIQDLEDFESSIPTSAGLTDIKNRLVAEIAEVRSIRTNEYGAVLDNITSVNGSLNNLEMLVSTIKPKLETVEEGLNNTDTYIKTNASTEIQNLLTSYADRLLRIVDSFVNHTKEAVRTEIGRCRPVWTVYESLLLDTLCGGLVDTWNGFWFTLGWCVIFFLPSLICSVKLAKFYRRMDPPKQTRNKSNNQRSMSVANAWLRSNKVRHFDYDRDW